jgi:Ca2+-binding EF-hand superfamily protein
LAIAVLAAACGSYYIYSSNFLQIETPSPNTSLHRSNAIHRRRRRNTATREDTASMFIDDSGDNDEDAQIVARPLTDGETVVDESAFQDEYNWNDAPQTYQRSGQNIVQLLFRVSEDATRRNAYVHRGCACNGCGVVPIRGIRYRCANCSDYDLCEGCESQGLHIKTHIFYKIRVPTPSFGPRHLQPVWYTGDPDSVMRVLPKELIAKLSRETGFERPELDAYWEQWTFMASTDWRDDPDDINLAMDRRTFERCLVPSGGYRSPAPSLIFDRMFAFYDTNKDDLIGFPEFLHGLSYRKRRDKWKKIFEGYDIDGDGFVERKDFLRMFRSYYVLYRQMHRDMLEGMDEQQMSTTEAHRLVSGRQPLSSAFGHDGRYPPAPDPRTGEGKTALPNGDLDITDGKGVINESGDDTGDRDDVFRRPLPGRHLWRDRGDRNSGAYWDAMLNPPMSVEQMPEVIANLTRRRRVRTSRRQRAEFVGMFTNSHPVLALAEQVSEENNASSSDSEEELPTDDDSKWPPRFVNVTDEDAEAVDGPGTRVADVHRMRQPFVVAHAIERERAQRAVYERWKRRQFYTDEEEGATPPADWNEDDDVLAQSGMVGESSNSQSRPSYHSRSSSRVRFAEDMDDFDTRSNPSTSSRSVPERWGGMDIPDAEKDAGKEILYQVTQQSFNELLDPLFKAKEDLALEAAESKSDRERYRHLYSKPEFETWAIQKRANEEGKNQETQERPPPPPVTRQPVWPNFPEVEVEEVRERPLDELLEATGYSIEGGETRTLEEPQQLPLNHSPDIEALVGTNIPRTSRPPTSPTEVLSIIAQYDDDRDPSSSSPRSNPLRGTPPSPSSPSSATITHRDPTLPQFRPSLAPPTQPTSRPASSRTPRFQEHITTPPLSPSPPTLDTLSKPTSQTQISSSKNRETDLIEQDKDYLFKLWKCDQAEREKDARGGWGRLDFEEFENVVRRFRKEESGNQMDYLGSWIEFCIP